MFDYYVRSGPENAWSVFQVRGKGILFASVVKSPKRQIRDMSKISKYACILRFLGFPYNFPLSVECEEHSLNLYLLFRNVSAIEAFSFSHPCFSQAIEPTKIVISLCVEEEPEREKRRSQTNGYKCEWRKTDKEFEKKA